MRVGFAIVALVAAGLGLMAAGAPPEVAGGARAEPILLGGIQVNEPDHDRWVRALRDAGLNTVAVTVYAKQGDWDSANLWFDDEDPGVLSEVRAAHRAGLAVVLILRVALDHAFDANRFYWHGMIQPETESDLDEWFRRYGAFVERWAAVAEREGIAVLGIASELNALTNTVRVSRVPALHEYFANAEKVEREDSRLLAHAEEVEERHLHLPGGRSFQSLEEYVSDRAAANARWARRTAYLDEADPVAAINRRRAGLERRWREVIERARSLYSGTLTYAANFDQFREVGFWDGLDTIGVNAYFPLLPTELLDRLEGEDLSAHLEAGWDRVLGELESFRTGRGIADRGVLFTEIGYVARAGATVRPWESSGFSVVSEPGAERLVVWQDRPRERHERAAALRALGASSRRYPGLLSGLLYWKLTTDPMHEEIEPFALVVESGPTRSVDDPALEALRSIAPPPDLLRELR